jgi:hypothetical protein
MSPEIYRYSFRTQADILDVEATLLLAILACESLHGATQTRLDAAHAFDAKKRSCVIDASTPVGRDFNKLFLGFVAREFGPDSFAVERAPAPPRRKAS